MKKEQLPVYRPEEVIGELSELWRYPVKSMLGERRDELAIEARGAVGDRLFAVRDAEGKLGSGKNTRRFRKIDGLLSFQARYRAQRLEVVLPDGATWMADDPAIHAALSEALGQPVTLAREAAVSHLDAEPLHLLSSVSLGWLQAALPGASVDVRRFRPNFVISTAGELPSEQGWLGKRLRLGQEVEIKVSTSTERCGMVAFAQRALPEEPQILRHIAQAADLLFGVYAEVIVPGTVRLHDPVTVIEEKS